jgi:L-alanine-DL-glutamate epimerase-like enolase superfamily enzyme
MKARLGRNYGYDHASLGILCSVLGPENRLMIEGNARYNLAQAQRMGAEYDEVGVSWFEEPFPPEETDNYLALRPKLKTPLAAGENEFGVQGFRELIDQHNVDIVQPDCSRAGGITECRRIGLLAEQHQLMVATHTWSDAVALVANMHLIASLPNGLTVEVDRTGNALVDQLLANPLRIVDGEVALPQAPGLGITLNEDVVERYRLPNGEPIPPGLYSDMAFGSNCYAPAAPYDAAVARDGRDGHHAPTLTKTESKAE